MNDNDNILREFEKLWAPCRIDYIEKIDSIDSGECIFCEKPREDDDAGNYIIHRGNRCFVILNIFPYNNGHLMIVPYRHEADLEALDNETLMEMMNMAQLVVRAMKKTMRPDGFNIGMNLGRSAGAGIAGHLHLHVVPRWNGDTNFMPVVSGTKVISESLRRTYSKISQAFREFIDNAGDLKSD